MIRANVCRRSFSRLSSCFKQKYDAGLTEPMATQSIYECSSGKVEKEAQEDMIVVSNFITVAEENSLLKDIEPRWRRTKYEFDHWDNAIQGFRETEMSKWSLESASVLQRVREFAFTKKDLVKTSVHVLDLAPDGFIKPHVDSVRFCGRLIAGLSLLSPSVMRLIRENNDLEKFSVLLNPRSLYVMKNRVRYEYTHEILKNEESVFDGKVIKKGRRISLMCRSEVEDQSITDAESIFKSKVITLHPED